MNGAAAKRPAEETRSGGPAAVAAPRRSVKVFEWFQWYARRYVRKKFHAVRLARGGFRPDRATPAGPMMVVVNHPSWWDPMLGFVLSDFWPGRVHVAPIDSAALAKYRFFERLGFFGIEPGTPRGARQFLRGGLAALDDPSGVLWVTAQGRFVDVRERPTRLKPGIGHLACRLRRGTVLPLAVEFTFWDESTPEAFARFGPPIPLGGPGEHPLDAAGWTDRVALALESAQDALAADVISRDASRFETILSGGSGVGGVYDLWRRLRSTARGEQFSAAHGATDD